jgi:hypothetical protein
MFAPAPAQPEHSVRNGNVITAPREKAETALPPEVQELVRMARSAMQRPMYGRLGMAAGQPWAQKVLCSMLFGHSDVDAYGWCRISARPPPPACQSRPSASASRNSPPLSGRVALPRPRA